MEHECTQKENMKKLTKAQHKRVRPLLRHEDKQRSLWFLLGAGLTLLIYTIIR